MKEATVSFPIRLPASVRDDLKALAEECEVSDQDIMRLALRIGLVDLRSLGKDQAQLIKDAADEAGVSFAAWAAKHPGQKAETESPPADRPFYHRPDLSAFGAEDPPTPATSEAPGRIAARHFLAAEKTSSSSPPTPASPNKRSSPAGPPTPKPGR